MLNFSVMQRRARLIDQAKHAPPAHRGPVAGASSALVMPIAVSPGWLGFSNARSCRGRGTHGRLSQWLSPRERQRVVHGVDPANGILVRSLALMNVALNGSPVWRGIYAPLVLG